MIDSIAMLRRLLRHAALVFLFLACASPQAARSAVIITANITDLADTSSGQDLWHADFTLSNAAFLANQGFTIYFDSLLYSDISSPVTPTPAGWDVLSIQPDTLLAAPGFLDGLALVNNPTLIQPFSVDFVWRGTGRPGSQPFQIYSQAGTFQILASGRTVVAGAVIPEPGTIAWALGIVGFLSVSARRRPLRVKFVSSPQGPIPNFLWK